jgi:hypothetical protein
VLRARQSDRCAHGTGTPLHGNQYRLPRAFQLHIDNGPRRRRRKWKGDPDVQDRPVPIGSTRSAALTLVHLAAPPAGFRAARLDELLEAL